MWIFDFLQKKPKTSDLTISHGVTWTNISSGMIQEEYNNDLQFPKSVEVYDEMRKSDATAIAILASIKQPLISARWQVQSGWEEALDKDIADFVTRNLFEKVKFKHFLRESFGFLDFGFYYFEKIYEVVDGKVEWKEFSPRIPRSHDTWGTKSQTDWVDGHPAWVTQQIFSSDESKSVYNEIPWNKIILFSYQREGNNFEGVSIFRPGYKHYFYKDLLYKIESISAERYGVGVPVAKVKNSMNEANKNKLVEMLKNIRSNEQSYWVYTDDVESLEILTPKGTWVGTMIQEAIKHHDRKMYDSILAGFLNLTTGEGGSNALSKDQSSFFLRGLQGIADFWIDVMNEHIKELVDMNWNGVKNYPHITVSDIGSISMDEQMSAIDQAYQGGLLDITDDDRQMIRDILKMPRLTSEQMKIVEWEREQKAIDEKKAMDEKVKHDEANMKKQEESKKKDKNLAEWGYTVCVMLNVSSKEIEEFKIDAKDLAESEYNGDYHVTLLFWLNTDISKKEITEKIKYDGQKVKIEGMKVFEWEESDVLVLECKKDKWLTDINASLRELDYKNDYPDYTPHITLAYCKKWEAKKYLSDTFDWLEVDTGKIVYTSSTESKPKTLLFSESVKPTAREVVFTKNITSFEQYLNKKYTEAENIVKEAEKEYKEALIKLYDESETQRIDGVVCLVYDKKRITKGNNLVKKITDKLEKKLIGSGLEKEIFDEALAMASKTLDDNEKKLASWTLEIKKGQIDTFIEGYKSNMQGVIYNESRRVLENITLNYGSEASLDLAKETADISINKNILMLSFVTHPRALYKFAVYTEAQKEGFTMFKTLVPTDKLPNVIDRPFGMTASLVFTIQTAAQINMTASAMTAGKTAEAVTGLWLHHGSFEYYYPIASTDLELEEEIARIQREELKNKMDENSNNQ